MLTIKISPIRKKILEIIKSGQFFEKTYQEMCYDLGLKSPQQIVNHITGLELCGLITVSRGGKKRKGKGYDCIKVNEIPEFQIIFTERECFQKNNNR